MNERPAALPDLSATSSKSLHILGLSWSNGQVSRSTKPALSGGEGDTKVEIETVVHLLVGMGAMGLSETLAGRIKQARALVRQAE